MLSGTNMIVRVFKRFDLFYACHFGGILVAAVR